MTRSHADRARARLETSRGEPCIPAARFATMCDMNRARNHSLSYVNLAFLLFAGALFSPSLPSARAQTGSIEFVARVRPAAGIAEPVRNLPFYLLNKSYADIQKEADAGEPKPDLDAFVDKLTVSKELKAWMKKNHTVSLSGEDFVQSLTVKDIMDVPEFFSAYVGRNSGDQSISFPTPKMRERDKVKNPDRYEKDHQEYLDAIRKFLTGNPDSKSGIDLNLDTINPGPHWQTEVGKRNPAIHRRTIDMAHTRYLVAQAQTDLDGRAAITGIPAGKYWLGTLEIFATAGDARLQWDVPVTVTAGETTRVELTNANAVELQKSAP